MRTILAIAIPATVHGQSNSDWTTPVPAFRVAGNLYYVGSKDLASYLVATPRGHILINSSLEASVPLIRASVEQLGFKFTDVKILLISHAHWDHDAGSAAIKKLTGAAYMVMDGDVSVVESGGRTDFHYGDDQSMRYPPAKVDRILHDGDEVRLGDATLVAHLTAGHTKGCTTWTMRVTDSGRAYNVVIVGSPNVNPGYRLVRNTLYPEIATDYERTFQVLRALPVDIFLGAHGGYFDLQSKYARLQAGEPRAFVDPRGYTQYVKERETAFRRELERQRQAGEDRPTHSRAAFRNDYEPFHAEPRLSMRRTVSRLALRSAHDEPPRRMHRARRLCARAALAERPEYDAPRDDVQHPRWPR